jgi:uncharacterized protein YbjT (DUF2867 family)
VAQNNFETAQDCYISHVDMRVLVLGATGGIGQAIIEQCLVQGHEVIVYARSPEKLPDKIKKDENVTIHKGGLTDETALASALTGVHVVTSALGPAVSKGPLHPPDTPLAKAYVLLLRLMKENDVKRLILLGEDQQFLKMSLSCPLTCKERYLK